MKDEIKEILDRLNFIKKEPNKSSYYPEDLLSREDIWLLLDYITNLQEELKSANESITWYSNRFKAVERDNKIYKLRHNKAIKKLSSAINHYNLEDKNNTILFVKEILEGNDISEKSYRKLNGGDE